MRHIIYILTDPITKLIHYIGYTSNEKIRLNSHCRGIDGTKEKRIWIRRLKKQGLKPIMEIIEKYNTAEELPEAETFWYGYFKLVGAELYNDPDFIGEYSRKGRKASEETRQKISKALKGKMPKNIEIFQKAGAIANIGRHPSEERIKKMSEEMSGKNNTFYGKHHTEESKRKISEANLGKVGWNKGKEGVQVAWNKGLTGCMPIPTNKKTTSQQDQEIIEKYKSGKSILYLSKEYGIDRKGIRSRIPKDKRRKDNGRPKGDN